MIVNFEAHDVNIRLNRALGLKINREIWNERQFDKIPAYFAEDFVSDYCPDVVRHGAITSRRRPRGLRAGVRS
jgi:hypothetical protein